MAKRRRKPSVQPPAASTPSVDAKPWYKKTWPWVTGLAVIASWVLLNGITALSNAEKLPSAVSGFYEKFVTWYQTNQRWTGKWTYEGNVDARDQPDIYVDLDLLVQNHTVQGTIGSGPKQKGTPFKFVLIEGSVVGDSPDVQPFDYFQGVPKRIATFKITRVDPENLKIVTTWQALPWFPKDTVLWRAGDTELLAAQGQKK